MSPFPRLPRALALAGGLLSLAACGSGGPATGTDATPQPAAASPAAVSVVASTNVWGDIARQVGGDTITVTAFISDPDQDPHSYEANAKNSLAVSKAQVVIENGGGYDDFLDRLISASKTTARVVNAVEVSGRTAPAGGELNEHVWYDLASVEKVATAVTSALSAANPAAATTYSTNAAALIDELHALEAKEAAIKAAHAGEAVGITEPVPVYLIEAAGLVNKTPAEFSEAIEEGDDVSPRALADTLAIYRDREVRALVYNEQTSGPTTEQVLAAARKAGIAVVPVTETLPQGKDYLSWMGDNVDALAQALGS